MKGVGKILVVIFLVICKISFCQTNEEDMQKQVLQNGIVDSLFVFGKWSKAGETETRLKYLGEINTDNGKAYKVMTSSFYWGLSHRATSRILIFNDKNQYLGNYRVTMVNDLPRKLENGKLIFNNANKDTCDKESVSEIDFKGGLPKSFFVKCKEEWGDIYSFENN